MKNKIGINLYWQTIKQLAIPAAVLGACCLVASVLNMFQPDITKPIYTIERFMRSPMYKFYGGEPIAAAIAPALIVFMYVGPAVFTYMAFKHLNSRPASDFYHSLANTRVCGYVTRILAVLTWQYGIILLSMSVSVVTMAAGGITFDFSFVYKLVLSYMAGSTLIAGGLALAMSLTGTLVSNFMMALVILVLPRTLLFIADRLIIYTNFYSFINLDTMGIFLNPVYNLPAAVLLDLTGIWENYGTSETLIHMGAMTYTFVLGLVYLALGLWGMARRKSELAGNGVQNALMRHLLSALVAFPFLVFGFFSTIKNGVFFSRPYFKAQELALFAGIGFLVFIIAEFILKRQIRSALKSLPVFIGAAVAALGLVFVQNTVALKISDTVPDEDEIEYISIDSNYATPTKFKPLYNYNTLLVKGIQFEEEEFISIVRDNLSLMVNNFNEIRKEGHISTSGFRRLYCEFKLKNGRSIFRNVYIYEDTVDEIWEIISTNPEYKSLSVALPPVEEVEDISIYYNLKMDEAYKKEFYTLFKTEFEGLPTVTKNEIVNERYSSLYRYLFDSPEYVPYSYIGNFGVSGTIGGYSYTSGQNIESRVPEAAKFYMQEINSGALKQFFCDIEAVKTAEGNSESGYIIKFEVINFNRDGSSPHQGFVLDYNAMRTEGNYLDSQNLTEILALFEKEDLNNVGFSSPIAVITIRKKDVDPDYALYYHVYAQLSMEEAEGLFETYIESYN